MNPIKTAQTLLEELEEERKTLAHQRLLQEHYKRNALVQLKMIVDECSQTTPDIQRITKMALEAADNLS